MEKPTTLFVLVISLLLGVTNRGGISLVSGSTIIKGHNGLTTLVPGDRSLLAPSFDRRPFISSNPYFAQGTSRNIRGIQKVPLQSYMSTNQVPDRGYSFGRGNPQGTAFSQPAVLASSSSSSSCADGQVLRADGQCVMPRITRNIYFFNAPARRNAVTRPVPNLPLPKVIENILLVKLPPKSRESVVVPLKEQKHYVFFLNRAADAGRDKVVSARPQPPTAKPEVYFVRYNSQGQDPGGLRGHGGVSLNDVQQPGGFSGGYVNSRDLFTTKGQSSEPFFINGGGGGLQGVNDNIGYK